MITRAKGSYIREWEQLLLPPFWLALRLRKLLVDKAEVSGVYNASGGKM